MKHSVPYSSFPISANDAFPNGWTAKRPVLRLDLLNGDKRLPCYAIVDSGADFCTFPLSFALQLGYNPLETTASTMGGVGNAAVPTFYWDVRLDFSGQLAFDVRASFTEGLDALGIGLLGQTGFFDRLKVMFDYRNGLFHIESD